MASTPCMSAQLARSFIFDPIGASIGNDSPVCFLKSKMPSMNSHPDLFHMAWLLIAINISMPYKISEVTGMLSIGNIVYGDMEARKETERNNAGKPEPGYSTQLDAAASNRHEQEKSIRPTRLLSKGLPPWERLERIKVFEKKKHNKKESSRGGKWTRVAVCCILCQIIRLWPRDNIHRLAFHPRHVYNSRHFPVSFLNVDAKLSVLPSFQVSNEKKERRAKKRSSQEYFDEALA